MNIDVNKYYDYRRKVLGTYVDRDGAYGSQCWDLYFDWCEKNGFKFATKLIPSSWFKESAKPTTGLLSKGKKTKK